MKYVLGIAVLFCLFGIASAQDPCQKPGGFTPPPSIIKLNPARAAAQSDIDDVRDALRAEADFKVNGPKLFTMDAALRESERTGKPVVCWMGPHLFASEKARSLSRELADTTIQAAMDTDGDTIDAKGNPLPKFRVKFSDGNYGKDAKVSHIPLTSFDKPGTAEKILQFARGGK